MCVYLNIYIYAIWAQDMGSALWKQLGTDLSSTPKVQDYTWTYRAAARHGAYDPRSLAREGGSLCPPYPATSPIITRHPHLHPPWPPVTPVQSFSVSYPTWRTPKNKIPYRKPPSGSVSRTVISLCNSVLRRLCASCSVWCACSSLSKPWVVQ